MTIGELRTCFVIGMMLSASFLAFPQKFVEPDKQKQFNITVNHEDYTIKTQMLSVNKDIKVDNDRTYMWYGSQKIMETKGGYDGKLIHGKYIAYYLNNQLKEQGTIKYGLKNKEWKDWYPDGKLRQIINWKNGVKNGNYELFNENGQRMAKGCFKNDKLHGKFFTYDLLGNVREKKVYRNGVEVIEAEKEQKIKAEKKKERVKKENTESGSSKEPKKSRKNKEKKNSEKGKKSQSSSNS